MRKPMEKIVLTKEYLNHMKNIEYIYSEYIEYFDLKCKNFIIDNDSLFGSNVSSKYNKSYIKLLDILEWIWKDIEEIKENNQFSIEYKNSIYLFKEKLKKNESYLFEEFACRIKYSKKYFTEYKNKYFFWKIILKIKNMKDYIIFNLTYWKDGWLDIITWITCGNYDYNYWLDLNIKEYLEKNDQNWKINNIIKNIKNIIYNNYKNNSETENTDYYINNPKNDIEKLKSFLVKNISNIEYFDWFLLKNDLKKKYYLWNTEDFVTFSKKDDFDSFNFSLNISIKKTDKELKNDKKELEKNYKGIENEKWIDFTKWLDYYLLKDTHYNITNIGINHIFIDKYIEISKYNNNELLKLIIKSIWL